MKRIFLKGLAAMLTLTLILAGCKKDPEKDIPKPVEQELIATLKVRLTQGAGSPLWFSYKVSNGFGGTGNSAVPIDTIRLQSHTTYSAAIFIYDESVEPPIDVTEEIVQEQNTHLFYYEPKDSAGTGGIRISDLNKDRNGEPFGQTSTWLTAGAGRGSLRIILFHGPRRKDGTTPAGIAGSTDAEAVFPVILF